MRYKIDRDGNDVGKKNVIQGLKRLLKPADTVYTVLNHVSASGMARDISLYIPSTHTVHGGARQKTIVNISWYVAKALDLSTSKTNGGVRVKGCGMDMGFHLVYCLGSILWPNGGYALKQPLRHPLKHQWL